MPGLSTDLAARHRYCESLLAAAEEALGARDWTNLPARLLALRRALLDHFWFEEGELFPALERDAQLGAPTQALRAQHKSIRQILEVLGAASPRHDPEGFRKEFHALAALLRQHAAEEERLVYPALEHVAAERIEANAQSDAPAPSVKELDVRWLDPPEPFVRIMAALSQAPGAPLRVLIHREPLPLYDALEARGLAWHTRALDEGGFEILIERLQD